MRRFLSAGMLAGLAAAHAHAAWAEPGFGYVYTAEIEEPGETELSLWATDRRGKGEGDYDAQDYKLEVERGISGRFGVSANLNLASHHVRGLGGEFDPVRRTAGVQGVEAEVTYRLLNPDRDGVGLAFVAEPAWSRISAVTGQRTREVELELKTVLQKEFLDERLVWVANLTLEPEWEREREAEGRLEKELAVEVASGVEYRVGRNWWLGVEGRYHSVYPNWTRGLHRENYAVYAGPTIHYSAGEWSLTATWLPQLFGGPSRAGSSLEFDDHERRELRLKISREF